MGQAGYCLLGSVQDSLSLQTTSPLMLGCSSMCWHRSEPNSIGVLSCRQQDEELDQLGQHVERIGGLGKEIHGELESQSR